MAFFRFISWVSACIGFISVTIFFLWFYTVRGGRQSKISTKKGLMALGVAVLSVIVFVITPSSDNQNAPRHHRTESSASLAAEESKNSESVTDDVTMDRLSKSKLIKYNSGLNKMLVEDQRFYARGKEEYAWTLFVTKIWFDRDAGLVMNANADFLSLSKKERKIVSNRAQNLAKAQMTMMDLPTSQDNHPLFLSIHDESDNRIGRSSALDFSDFKWFH